MSALQHHWLSRKRGVLIYLNHHLSIPPISASQHHWLSRKRSVLTYLNHHLSLSFNIPLVSASQHHWLSRKRSKLTYLNHHLSLSFNYATNVCITTSLVVKEDGCADLPEPSSEPLLQYPTSVCITTSLVVKEEECANQPTWTIISASPSISHQCLHHNITGYQGRGVS